MAELPIAVGLGEPWRVVTHIFYQQTIHSHPLLAGQSSFVPPTYVELINALDNPPDVTPTDIGLLQSMDVRYLVLNNPSYKRSHWARIVATMPTYSPVTRAASFGDMYNGDDVYTLAPLTPDQWLQLSATPPAQLSVAAPFSLTLTIRNSYTYPLLSRLRPQLQMEAGWEPVPGAGGAAGEATNWQHLSLDLPLALEPGLTTHQVPLLAPATAGRYRLRLRLPWSLPHYRLDGGSEVMVER